MEEPAKGICLGNSSYRVCNLRIPLNRPREAKKMLDCLLAAPGTIGVGRQHITVTLMPAANSTERAAFRHFLDDVSRLNLRLPGDPSRRTLRFRCSNG